jgi:FkbH-like protein
MGTLDENGSGMSSAPWVSELERQLAGSPVLPGRLIGALVSTFLLSHLDEGLRFLRKYRDHDAFSPAILTSVADDVLKSLLSGKRLKESREVLQVFESLNIDATDQVLQELAEASLASGEVEFGRCLLERIVVKRGAAPGAIRALYQMAKQEARWQEAHIWLNRLVEADGSPGTVAFAFRERTRLPTDGGKAVRIALLSSYVLDNLVHHLDFECRKGGISPEFYVASFNQYSQDILNGESGLYRFTPDIIMMAIGLDDLVPELKDLPSVEVLERAAESVPAHMGKLVEELLKRSGALVVVHEFMSIYRSPLGILDNRSENGISGFILKLNQKLREAMCASNRTFLLPLSEVIGWVGQERSYDPKMHYLASMKVTHSALPHMAQYSMRYIKPLKGAGRKCIVLDLDGTLWGGIVGEAGIDGIRLGPVAPGVEYEEFQRALAALAKKGVILAVCSKNNREDVIPVLRTHKHMVLREEHFGAMRINWGNKADNIREIAHELNIGLDSMVFMDDNPVERELIRQMLPEVLTVEMPKDPSRYRLLLESMTDFDLLAMTREDAIRGMQYQAMAQRDAARTGANSLEDYLRSLDIHVEITLAESAQLARLVQLFNKTNQFNLTTKRYQAVDVDKFHHSQDCRLYALSVKDRFGDHGLVGTALVFLDGAVWRIDSLLMSCRVMGLSVETAFLERICRDAQADRASRLVGEFSPTRKNQPVKDFYSRHGFELEREEGEGQTWALTIAESPVYKPDWIN